MTPERWVDWDHGCWGFCCGFWHFCGARARRRRRRRRAKICVLPRDGEHNPASCESGSRSGRNPHQRLASGVVVRRASSLRSRGSDGSGRADRPRRRATFWCRADVTPDTR